MDSFGVPANGMIRTFAAQEPQSSIFSGRSIGGLQAIRQVANRNINFRKTARPHLRVIGSGCEINTDFSLLIGVANAFVFEAIVCIAILVVWYGAESLYAAALAN